MTLGSAATRPRPASPEHDLLASIRSGGFGVRYDDDDAVHRIVAPTQHGNTVVGLIVIREQRIMYAEFDRQVFPWWGRVLNSPEYVEAFMRLSEAVIEWRRK